MNWDAIGAVGEVIGAVAVIVTIAYLARQIRENSNQVRVSSRLSLGHLANEAFDPIYNNDRNIRIWTQGHSAPHELNAEDEVIFSLFMSRLVVVMQTAISQSMYGVHLSSEDSDIYLGTLKSVLDSPGGSVWLNEMGGEDFVTETTRRLLAETGFRQRSVVHSKDGPLDTPRQETKESS